MGRLRDEVQARAAEIKSVVRKHRGMTVALFGSVARGDERPGYRVVTAGVIGANIGGGLVLLAAIPATLLALAAFVVVTVAPSSRAHGRPTH